MSGSGTGLCKGGDENGYYQLGSPASGWAPAPSLPFSESLSGGAAHRQGKEKVTADALQRHEVLWGS